MELCASAHFLAGAWIAKCWMEYVRASWIDTNDFSLLVVEAYADRDEFLPEGVHLDWLSLFEWRHRCLVVTHSLGHSRLPQSWSVVTLLISALSWEPGPGC